MKILITNYAFDFRNGTLLYTLDVANFFKSKGDDVYIYSPYLGKLARDARKSGIEVTDDLSKWSGVEFDIIHSHHFPLSYIARAHFRDVPMVFVSHGVLPNLEKPPHGGIGIARYVAVSEEVKNKLISLGIKSENITIIRSFVDTEKFKKKNPISKKLKKVLVLSNYWRDPNKSIVENACKELGLELEIIGARTKQVDDVWNYINNNDLVITLGRGALEALSCGRAVIVYDYDKGDGLVTTKNIHEIKKNNFSGRCYGIKFTVESLVKELKKYDPSDADVLSNTARDEFSLEKAMNIYKKLYDEVLLSEVHGGDETSISIGLEFEKMFRRDIRRKLGFIGSYFPKLVLYLKKIGILKRFGQ